MFPLPEKAAVDHLRMQIGERVIEGQIKERGEARRTYEAAKTEGRKTTLVEQERPNMFTTSVANIGPGEEVVVAIEYQETLRYDDGTFRAALPAGDHAALHPGHAGRVGRRRHWAGRPPRSRCSTPTASRRRSPTAHDGYVNPVTITIDLHAGFPLAQLVEHLPPDATSRSSPATASA